MIREFKNPTLIIEKDAFLFLVNQNRLAVGCTALPPDKLEQRWTRMRHRNGGASQEKHPITENEVRISKDSFNFSLEVIKSVLPAKGFTFREDGFIEEGCYM